MLPLITAVHNYNEYVKLNPVKSLLEIHASQWKILILNETYSELVNHHRTIAKLADDVEKRNYTSIKIQTFIQNVKHQTSEIENVISSLLQKQLSEFSASSATKLESLYVTTTDNLTLFDRRVVIPMMKPMIKKNHEQLKHWTELLNNTRLTLNTLNSPLEPHIHNVYQAFIQLTSQTNQYATYAIDGKKSLKVIKQLRVTPKHMSEPKLIPISEDLRILSELLTEYAYLYRFTSSKSV
ncbi:hypothetical protein PCIT_b0032 [Pseudoalteromonas citrea]|uniref:Uncharacterized protein n=2 Tax=Pseudoalteromonas citrea TaxID=43655 RepID=A0AAD4ADW9_9GAMM|nr:hypothetical protein PCIT_b0032 [Pseudoalteromonas citrea]